MGTRSGIESQRHGRWMSLRENAFIMALAGDAFAGSYGHILHLFETAGAHGWDAYATAAVVDVIVWIGTEERQRDLRVDRPREHKVTFPVTLIAGGVVLTIAANAATAQPTIWGVIQAVLPSVALLGAIVILERRSMHALRQRKAAAAVLGAGASALAGTEPGTEPGTVTAGTGSQGAGNRNRTGTGTKPGSGNHNRTGTRTGAGTGAAEATRWTPPPASAAPGIQPADAMLSRVRDLVSEYASRNGGRLIPGDELGRALGIRKDSALTLRSQVVDGSGQNWKLRGSAA